MIVSTLNCRGLASLPKKLAVCRLVEYQHIDVFFFQEIMGDGHVIAGEMEVLFSGWTLISMLKEGLGDYY